MHESNNENIGETNQNRGGAIFGFFKEISIIEHLSRSKMERVLPDDMKASHFGVLNHLVHRGKKESPAELASAFQVARPSMTNTLQKLENKAYVIIKADPKDGRAKLVAITTTGIKAHQKAMAALPQGYAKLVENLGEELFVSVLPALEKIRQYMDDNRD